MADSDMRGKVVVITGATSGIGQAATEKLAERGARIVQIARDRERGDVALKKWPPFLSRLGFLGLSHEPTVQCQP